MRGAFYILMFLLGSFSLSAQPTLNPRVDLSPAVVFFNGDTLRSSILGGLSLDYRLTSDFWIGTDFYGGGPAVDQPNGLGLKSSDNLILWDGAIYWNLPTQLGTDPRWGKADFYTALGLGYLWVGPQKTVYGFIGGGLHWHTGWRGLALRCDLKNLFYTLNNSQGADFNFDMALGLGPSWMF